MKHHFPSQANPIIQYRTPKSGHCHRVELMLSLLNLPYKCIDLDIGNGEHKKSAHLNKSALGQVPAIEDNGTTLSDSNAILVYLINRYSDDPSKWLSSSAAGRAEIQKWFSIAAGELAYGPCTMRLKRVFHADVDFERARLITDKLFKMMENHLQTSPFLAGESITAADIAMYSYTAHAPEGGFELTSFKAIQAWLAKIESVPNFVPMLKTAF